MKYMIMVSGTQGDWDAMSGGTDDEGRTWSAADLQAMFRHMDAVTQELRDRGEFVDAQGLASPATTRTVRVVDGERQVTGGPAGGGSRPVIAGYWIVECDSEDRAVEIAARVSTAPIPGGEPGSDPVEVRQVMEEPDIGG